MQELDAYYLSQAEPNQGCLLTLRRIILGADPGITETRKYGMPCFCLGKKPLCYLWTDKKSDWPYVLFVEGKRINHPDLVVGSRKRMKVLHLNPYGNINQQLITDLLKQLIDSISIK